MKKLIVALVACAITGVALAQFETLSGNAKYEGKTGLKPLLVAIDANTAIIPARLNSPGSGTNTPLSSYTSRYVGDILLGTMGGTNWVWISTTASVTNAWGNGWAR